MGLFDKIVDTAAKKALITTAGEAASKTAEAAARCALEQQNSSISIKAPDSADNYTGRNYEEVEEELRAYGFVNIALLAKKDLINGWMTKIGSVAEVSINGKTNFKKGQRYLSGDRIVITYHAMRRSSPAKLPGHESAAVGSTHDERPPLYHRVYPEGAVQTGRAPEPKEEMIRTVQEPRQLRCKGCNAVMELDFENGIATCPYCGSTEAISESDSVKIERMRINAEAEWQKNERERAKSQEQQNAVNQFKSTTFSKVILVAVFLTLTLAISNFRYRTFASIVMFLSGAILAFSWLTGAGLVKNVKQKSYAIFALAGFVLLIIAFGLG